MSRTYSTESTTQTTEDTEGDVDMSMSIGGSWSIWTFLELVIVLTLMISFGLRWHYNLKLQRYEDTYGLPHADALPLAESSRRRYLSIGDTSRYPMCFVSVVAWLRTLGFMNLSPQIGPLITTFTHMVNDVLQFMVVLAVLIMGFASGFMVLYKHDIDNFDTVSKSVSIMLNMIFPDHFGFEVESLGFARYWGHGMLMAFLVIVNTVLLNLLIAMMTNSYTRVKANSIDTWRLTTTEVVAKFSTEVHTVWSLSPLNLLGVSALLDRSLYMNPLDNQTKTPRPFCYFSTSSKDLSYTESSVSECELHRRANSAFSMRELRRSADVRLRLSVLEQKLDGVGVNLKSLVNLSAHTAPASGADPDLGSREMLRRASQRR